MKEFILSVLGILAAASGILQYISSRTKAAAVVSTNPDFLKFRQLFLGPYLLSILGDWLQGPYVYRLYSQYGFDPGQIAFLYVIGFAASALCGTFAGPLADRFGRKRACIVFCMLYSVCCLTKLSPDFYWLAFGRICGGISTSILFSAFEAWYVCHHMDTGFPSEWISSTFSMATFWNGVLAILAGILADVGAEWLEFGPVAPFMTAVPFLVMAGVLMATNWQENFGSTQTNIGRSCAEGLRVIFSNEIILFLGVVQSMFESVMYIFVFIWTPVLDASNERWPLGLVFSSFMVCIMLGSSFHSLLMSKGFRPQYLLHICIITAFCSMLVCSYTTDPSAPMPVASYLAFLVLEVAIGLYFPSIGYLRSQVIPESLRANIMNWFRLPLNVITCCVLLWLHRQEDSPNGAKSTSSGDHFVFLLCAIMSAIGVMGSYAFSNRFQDKRSFAESEKTALDENA
ncbi:molybdate-anion transporter-like [Artemia franciscana]|nr:hypothetical protein QYM36_002526 [Artemia franciscana]